MIAILAGAFGVTAFIYSLAGFAGGSTYLALLVFASVSHTVAPIIALMCNTVVSSFNSVAYWRAGLIRPRLLLPHMALAIPCAYLGGRMEVSKIEFEWVTALCLLWSAMYLIANHRKHDETLATTSPPLPIALAAGAILGFVSGIIGIGGGIFLSPLLYAFRAGTSKEIASTCSLFILVNSLAGLVGQLQKSGVPMDVMAYWLLPVAVLIGGWAGTHFTLRVLSFRYVTLCTGIILLLISLRLWWEIFMNVSR